MVMDKLKSEGVDFRAVSRDARQIAFHLFRSTARLTKKLTKKHTFVSCPHKVRAVSGSGQQHGSVYWAKSAGDKLRALNPEQALAPQLENCFSVADGPIWMDSSTGAQCATLEENVGGPQAMAELTGAAPGWQTDNEGAKAFFSFFPAFGSFKALPASNVAQAQDATSASRPTRFSRKCKRSPRPWKIRSASRS